ncbi:MAG: flippase-like domain-containing protein, partial [Muribaculaceae bacterium]|nr:flippase-like domain-containing protein [Muribaculaceae bacterium]
TTLSWFSRYFVVNALFWAFVPGVDQILVFGRQFVVWVVLMVSPTPGGSGVSEWLFTNYYGDLIGTVGLAAILALVWRLLSYYIYLIIGVSLLPGYFGDKSKKK